MDCQLCYTIVKYVLFLSSCMGEFVFKMLDIFTVQNNIEKIFFMFHDHTGWCSKLDNIILGTHNIHISSKSYLMLYLVLPASLSPFPVFHPLQRGGTPRPTCLSRPDTRGGKALRGSKYCIWRCLCKIVFPLLNKRFFRSFV